MKLQTEEKRQQTKYLIKQECAHMRNYNLKYHNIKEWSFCRAPLFVREYARTKNGCFGLRTSGYKSILRIKCPCKWQWFCRQNGNMNRGVMYQHKRYRRQALSMQVYHRE